MSILIAGAATDCEATVFGATMFMEYACEVYIFQFLSLFSSFTCAAQPTPTSLVLSPSVCVPLSSPSLLSWPLVCPALPLCTMPSICLMSPSSASASALSALTRSSTIHSSSLNTPSILPIAPILACSSMHALILPLISSIRAVSANCWGQQQIQKGSLLPGCNSWCCRCWYSRICCEISCQRSRAGGKYGIQQYQAGRGQQHHVREGQGSGWKNRGQGPAGYFILGGGAGLWDSFPAQGLKCLKFSQKSMGLEPRRSVAVWQLGLLGLLGVILLSSLFLFLQLNENELLTFLAYLSICCCSLISGSMVKLLIILFMSALRYCLSVLGSWAHVPLSSMPSCSPQPSSIILSFFFSLSSISTFLILPQGLQLSLKLLFELIGFLQYCADLLLFSPVAMTSPLSLGLRLNVLSNGGQRVLMFGGCSTDSADWKSRVKNLLALSMEMDTFLGDFPSNYFYIQQNMYINSQAPSMETLSPSWYTPTTGNSSPRQATTSISKPSRCLTFRHPTRTCPLPSTRMLTLITSPTPKFHPTAYLQCMAGSSACRDRASMWVVDFEAWQMAQRPCLRSDQSCSRAWKGLAHTPRNMEWLQWFWELMTKFIQGFMGVSGWFRIDIKYFSCSVFFVMLLSRYPHTVRCSCVKFLSNFHCAGTFLYFSSCMSRFRSLSSSSIYFLYFLPISLSLALMRLSLMTAVCSICSHLPGFSTTCTNSLSVVVSSMGEYHAPTIALSSPTRALNPCSKVSRTPWILPVSLPITCWCSFLMQVSVRGHS